ncbi:DUF3040 domain-containing protein [Salinactinospora qingdaonensis]|uniref:DUF3040 domain-containing protein n=1 Tax=Salinactinospora qingdaonensis TaxID=702744 RepID=A0ABP7F1J5_9ACTN
MALRENERRILAQIEHHLTEDDPELAGHLTSFGADDPAFMRAAMGAGWKPWAVCAAIGAAVIGLLIVLFLTTSTQAVQDSAPQQSGDVEVTAPNTQPQAP